MLYVAGATLGFLTLESTHKFELTVDLTFYPPIVSV